MDDTGSSPRFMGVDTNDPGVGVRTPMDRDVEHSREGDISHVAAMTSD
jgi:hypothetical protein